MLTFFYTFPPFRQADHWVARWVILCPSPPPPDSSYHFFNDLFLINNSSLGSGRRFKINSGYFKYGPLEPGYLLSPPPAGGGGGAIYFKPIWGRGKLNSGRGLTWFRKDDGSLTTILIWNYPPLPLKHQKISNNAGKGRTGNLIRLPLCLFPAQTRRARTLFWLGFAQRAAQ